MIWQNLASPRWKSGILNKNLKKCFHFPLFHCSRLFLFQEKAATKKTKEKEPKQKKRKMLSESPEPEDGFVSQTRKEAKVEKKKTKELEELDEVSFSF